MNQQATTEAKPASGAKAERDRFVAFSFCWADVLLELDADRKVSFAGGAIEAILGRGVGDAIGTPFHDLVIDADRGLADDVLTVIAKRGRVDGVMLRMKSVREDGLAMAVAGYSFGDLGGQYYLGLRAIADEGEGRDSESGLYTAESFGEMASRQIKQAEAEGKEAEMTLVSLGEYEGLQERIGDDGEASLNQSIGAALRANSINGDAAAKVADGRYALVHETSLDVAGLQSHIADLTKAVDPTGQGAEAEAGQVALEAVTGMTEEDLASGLVYAINQFSHAQAGTFSISEFSKNLGNLVEEAQSTVANFKQVVRESNFDVAFHPILSAKTGAIHHYEALVRFRGDMGGESPFRYITFAEETGLIWEFDIEMARKVMEWLKTHPDKSASVAVNISGHSIAHPGYLERLQAMLAQNTWARGRLLFEITESSRIENLDETNEVLQKLRKDGYEVCLDDFGAGAASFQYLSVLEVDVVKLDGSAVKNAQRARKGRALMSALTRLCKDLDVKTVAEMVDDEKGLDFVRDCGVDYVQGFLFGKPNIDIADADKHALASAREFFIRK